MGKMTFFIPQINWYQPILKCFTVESDIGNEEVRSEVVQYKQTDFKSQVKGREPKTTESINHVHSSLCLANSVYSENTSGMF